MVFEIALGTALGILLAFSIAFAVWRFGATTLEVIQAWASGLLAWARRNAARLRYGLAACALFVVGLGLLVFQVQRDVHQGDSLTYSCHHYNFDPMCDYRARPSIASLYQASFLLHNSLSFLARPDIGFENSAYDLEFDDIRAALKGTRFESDPVRFFDARNTTHLEALKKRFEYEDRAKLTINRGANSVLPLVAAVANSLTDPIILVLLLLVHLIFRWTIEVYAAKERIRSSADTKTAISLND